MTQRIYWVPHTVCPYDCLHCHNDSVPRGVRTPRSTIDRIIAQLPDSDSAYRLEDVLVGGGEGLVRGAGIEYLVRAFRERFPRGSQATIEERRAAGHVILSIQTAGPPLADRDGNASAARIDYWMDLGVDYIQVASSDMFHRSRHPDYAWDTLEASLTAFGEERGIEFLIYGKEVNRLVPSGRVLENLDALQDQGARLLTGERYCADGWETGSRFLSGLAHDYPQCSEVVIDTEGWVHPCCWYLLSPGLFDLTVVDFETGMRSLQANPLCLAIDCGDILAVADIAGQPPDWASQVRDAVGDCGICRLASVRLASQPGYAWMRVPPLSAAERAFYARLLGQSLFEQTVP